MIQAAYFRFRQETEPKDAFTIKLADPKLIQMARDFLSGKNKETFNIGGIISKTAVAYNRPWHFHLEPASIDFFDISIEVCDATIRFVEEHLEEVGGSFLPNNRWCPWRSRLIEEVINPILTTESDD